MRRGTAVVLGYTWPRFHPLSLYSLMVLFAEPARWSRLLIFHELKKNTPVLVTIDHLAVQRCGIMQS